MVSVIIPSYNSESTIGACLKSLNQQSFEEEYEIILADSSEDKTPEIVRDTFPHIKFIHFDFK